VHGKNLHSALEDRKIAHEWIYHLNEGHGYFDLAHRTDMYEKVVAFLDRNIGSGAAAASASAGAGK
jgi:dipeptidyl aminopeptidase/acylaminoacyl peptidase